jgi:hypothetical protein
MKYQRYKPFDSAVAKMTRAAQSEGRNNLIMTVDEWMKLVIFDMKGGVREFGVEIVKRTTDAESIDITNRFLSLAMNIWNAMPEAVRRLGLRRIERNRLNYNSP